MATVRTIQVRISSNSASYIGALKKAEGATRQFNATLNNTAKAATANTRAAKTTTANYASVSRGAQAAMNNVQRLGGSMWAGSKAMNAAATATGRVGKSLAVLKSITVSALASLAGFWAIHVAIQTARKAVDFMKESVLDFNQAMTESTAIMGDLSDESVKSLERAAMATAKISTFTPAEAAEGLYFLASAGYTADQSMKLLPVSAKFAQAGIMDLEKATESLTDIQKAVSGSFDDMRAVQKGNVLYNPNDIELTTKGYQRVADVVAKTAVISNATIEQVAEGLTGKLGPQLRLLNKDIEEGSAILATYANVGIKGRVASTAAAMALRDLQTRAIKNSATFEKFGLTVFDSAGYMLNTADIIGQLEQILGGMNDEQKRATLLQMGFQDRSVGALLALVGYSNQIRKFEADLRNAGGTVDEISQKQLQSFNNQLKLVTNNLRNVAINVGKFLESGIKKVAGIMAPAFEAVNKAVSAVWKNFKPFAETLGKIVGGAAIATFMGLSKVIELIAKGVQKFSKQLAIVGAWVGAGIVAAHFSSLFFLIKSGLETVYLKSLYAKDGLFKFVNSLLFLKGQVANSTFGTIIGYGFLKIGDYARAAVVSVKSFAVQMIMNLGAIKASAGGMLSSIGGFFSQVIPKMKTFATTAKTSLTTFTMMAMDFARNPFANLALSLDILRVKLKTFLMQAKGFGSNLLTYFRNPIANTSFMFDALRTKLATMGISFKNFGSIVRTAAINVQTSFLNLKTTIVTSLLQMTGAQKIFSLEFVKGMFKALWNAIASTITSFNNLRINVIASLLQMSGAQKLFSMDFVRGFFGIGTAAKATQTTVVTSNQAMAASSSALGSALQIVITGIMLMYQSIQKNRADAQQAIGEMFGSMKDTTYNEQIAKMLELTAATEKYGKVYEEIGTGAGGKLRHIRQLFNPFDENTVQDAYEKSKAAVEEYEKLREKMSNFKTNTALLDDFRLAGESVDEFRQRVSIMAEKAGVDLTQLPRLSSGARAVIESSLNSQSAAFAKAGKDINDYTDVGTEEITQMADAIDEQSKEIGKSFATLFDPSTALSQAEAMTEAIMKPFKSTQDVFNDLKSNLEKAAREAFDAAQKAAEEAAKKNKQEYDKPDFEFTPKINATQFLGELQKQSAGVQRFRMQMANLSNLGASDALIQGLSELGDDAVPILEQLGSMLPAEAKKVVDALNAEFAKFEETPTVLFSQMQAQIAKQAGAARAFASNINVLASLGLDPEQLRVLLADPKYAGLVQSMVDNINMAQTPEAKMKAIADVVQTTKDIYDMKNIETSGITAAMETAMLFSLDIATKGADEIVRTIATKLGKTPEEVVKQLDLLASMGITIPGYTPGMTPPSANPPAGAGGAGGGAAKPSDKNNPNPAIGTASITVDKRVGNRLKKEKMIVPKYNLPPGWKKGGNPNSKFLKKGDYWADQNGKAHRVGYFAQGGMEKHNAMIAKGGVRVWAEPETGGEAYIPLASSKRGRSSRILEQVAKEFGYGLVKYANGGFFGTAGSQMVGGGQFGTSSGQAVQTVVVPVQSKNETNFNGPIVGVNMEDAVRFAEQKKRQKALTR